MKKVIDLKKILNIINKIYEDASNIKILQDEIEELLGAIDKINLEYNRGKISKEIFDRDEKKFKKESIKLIKIINKLVSSDLNSLNIINNDLTPQKLVKNSSEVSNQIDTQPANIVDSDGNKQN